MNTRRVFLFNCLILILIFWPGISFSQYLVKIEGDLSKLNPFEQSGISWFYAGADLLFARSNDSALLNKSNLPYTVLDTDMETFFYFWVEDRFQEEFSVIEQISDPSLQILWQQGGNALIRSRNHTVLNDLPDRFFGAPLYFHKNFPRISSSDYPPIQLPLGGTSAIQAILDSVNINQLYESEEHLTGEKPFWTSSGWDSIMTRYSYSDEISKAEGYIQSKLESYGYVVELHPFTMNTFYDIEFAPSQSQTGWTIGVDKIWRTTDNGQNWNLQYQGSSGSTLWSIFPVSDQILYAVGDYGTILKTVNGGDLWTLQTSPTGAFLFGVFFRNDSLGWICGDNGIILKTTDGGQNWTLKNTPIFDRLYDIFFVDDQNGWAVGRSGRIIHTTNGGESWTTQASGTTTRLYGVHFINNTTGFVVGWSGTVRRTTDAGTNWTMVSVPTGENLYDIDFVGADTGMIAGFDGACLKTTNGGLTWSAATNVSQANLYGMDLRSSGTVWCSGSRLVAYSNDLGISWTAAGNIQAGSLNNVIATKLGTAYPDQYYIICGHYDCTSEMAMTRAPGADDNGSGTSGVIEAARVLAPYHFKYSIKFILFAGEEQGLFGSQAYASQAAASGEQIMGVLNMDMIAYDGNNDGLFEIHAGSMGSSQAIGTLVAANVSAWNLPLNPEYKTTGSSSASDHSSFWNYGFPAIMIIEDFQDFTPFYHTTNDLLSTLRLPYFHAVAQLTIGTLAELAIMDSLTGLSRPEITTSQFLLSNPYPNPFNPEVNIRYQLIRQEIVQLDIYDLLGRKVKQLWKGEQQPGVHYYSWDGTNSSGVSVASGIYIVRFQSGEHIQQKKITLIR
ncbi:MAG: hypothetical protein Kow0042_23820 [Calditrichia bacterium]